MKLTAILWDLDGTLIDSEPYWFACESDLARLGGATWTRKDAEAVVGASVSVTAQRILAISRLNWPVATVEARLIDMMAERVRSDGVPFRPGAAHLVAAAQQAGLRQALVTASSGPYLDAVWEQLSGFELRVSGADVARSKPDPESYLLAMRRLDVSAQECLAIEDSPPGAASAIASGAATIYCPTLPDQPAPAGAHRVESLAGLTVAALAKIHAGGRSTTG